MRNASASAFAATARLVNKRLGSKRRLRSIRIPQVAGEQRSLPHFRQTYNIGVTSCGWEWNNCPRARRRCHRQRSIGPRAHELCDQRSLRIVVTQMIEVGCPRVVFVADQITVRVQRAAHLPQKRGSLGIPRRFPSSRIHCIRTGRPSCMRDPYACFGCGVLCRESARILRTLHVNSRAPCPPAFPKTSRCPRRIPYVFMSFDIDRHLGRSKDPLPERVRRRTTYGPGKEFDIRLQ